MNISANTLEALRSLSNQDATLLANLYTVQSLEQAVNIVSESATRFRIAIDPGELTTYLQNSLAVPAFPE